MNHLSALSGLVVLCVLHAGVAHARSTPRVASAKGGKAKEAAAVGGVRPRKVAVAQFAAPPESHVRNSVLAELANQDDVDVASLDDITFISRRYKLDMNTPEGRKKISDELGVKLWIDGTVTGDTAMVTLTKANGKHVAQTEVKAPTPRLLDALTGERVWSVLGSYLSPREGRRKALLAENERAHQKIEARVEALDRQRTLARQAAKHAAAVAKQAEKDRASQLEEERNRATTKRVAVLAELSRQSRLALERKEQRLAAQQRAEAVEARQQQLAAARIAPPQEAGYASAGYAVAPAQETGYAAAGRSGYATSSNRWSSRPAAPVAPARPAVPPAATPAQPAKHGVSEATQRWLMQQPGYRPPMRRPADDDLRAPGTVTTQPQPTGYAANGGEGGAPAASDGNGVSPATQRWLEQQRLR